MALRRSLATKLLIALCSVITLALGILVLVVNQRLSGVAEEQALQTATEVAERNSLVVKAQLEKAMAYRRDRGHVEGEGWSGGAEEGR